MSGGYIKEGDVLEHDASTDSCQTPTSPDSVCGAAEAAFSTTAAPVEAVIEG